MNPGGNWSPDRKWSPEWTANDPRPQVIPRGKFGIAWTQVTGSSRQVYHYKYNIQLNKVCFTNECIIEKKETDWKNPFKAFSIKETQIHLSVNWIRLQDAVVKEIIIIIK